MTQPDVVSDVFLSASAPDASVAEVVRRSFEARGLTVFASLDQRDDGQSEEAIRSAMAECRAFVAILSRAALNDAAITIELGAAWAWDKLIYLLLEGLTPRDVPSWLAHHPMAPVSEVARAIDEIGRSIEPLTDEQVRILGNVYASVGVGAEQLASRPASLDQLTRRFNRRVGASFSPERVLQELIRLRKRGGLPRLKRQTG